MWHLKRQDIGGQRISSAFSEHKSMNWFRLFAVFAAAGATYAFSTITKNSSTFEGLVNSLSVMTSSSATILGFLVSAGALLYAVANTTLARNLQRTGHFQKMLGELFFCASTFLASLLIGFVCLFLSVGISSDVSNSDMRFLIGSGAFVLVSSYAYLMLIPLGYKMWLVLSNITPSRPGALE